MSRKEVHHLLPRGWQSGQEDEYVAPYRRWTTSLRRSGAPTPHLQPAPSREPRQPHLRTQTGPGSNPSHKFATSPAYNLSFVRGGAVQTSHHRHFLGRHPRLVAAASRDLRSILVH
ncbi:hypothetical protein CPLU01_08937 [Colletotrichum plurivorum]|uniref:Uncharacterized protein n=1 Tax=Colletotrichum plurivorum TaxID=2175906 RepID=A0A8H6NBS7_9PEZI|nr:hypothetical protein CPLU01_08937 [Colletotrichum plurivorum]